MARLRELCLTKILPARIVRTAYPAHPRRIFSQKAVQSYEINSFYAIILLCKNAKMLRIWFLQPSGAIFISGKTDRTHYFIGFIILSMKSRSC